MLFNEYNILRQGGLNGISAFAKQAMGDLFNYAKHANEMTQPIAMFWFTYLWKKVMHDRRVYPVTASTREHTEALSKTSVNTAYNPAENCDSFCADSSQKHSWMSVCNWATCKGCRECRNPGAADVSPVSVLGASQGHSVVLLNLSNNTTTAKWHVTGNVNTSKCKVHTLSPVSSQTGQPGMGNDALVNGALLQADADGSLPAVTPTSMPCEKITIPAYSFAFVTFPAPPTSGPTSTPTAAPTHHVDHRTVIITHPITFDELSASEYTGNTKVVYETAYGIGIGIYANVSWVPGCSVASSITRTRRSGSTVTFVAHITTDDENTAATATAAAKAMNESRFVQNMVAANTVLSMNVTVPTVVKPAAPSTKKGKTDDSGSPNDTLVLVVVIAGCLLVITALAGLTYRAMGLRPSITIHESDTLEGKRGDIDVYAIHEAATLGRSGTVIAL